MGGNTHDGSCTVISKDIIGKPDGNLLSVQRINRIGSGEYACFFLVLKTVHIRLHGSVIDVFVNSVLCFRSCQGRRESMLGSKNHKGCSVKGIRSCGIDGDLLLSSVNREFHFRAIGFADPVRLHLLNFLGPVKLVQIVQKAVRIFGDTQHPLTEILLGHRRTAPFATSVYHLFVGKTSLTGRTPVNGEFLLVCQTFLKHLHEDPLCPFVEIGIRGVYFHIPVIDRRDIVDLLLDILHVLGGGDSRMNAHLDGVVLRREAEGIPAHGMDQVISLKHFITAPHIRDHIASPVSHVETVA